MPLAQESASQVIEVLLKEEAVGSETWPALKYSEEKVK